MKRPWLPALVLFFGAPAVGELLCGNMPPSKFFNPAALVCVSILYGGAAILIREAALRWDKGWPTILALGAAYAVIEEGLMVKSFFNPTQTSQATVAGPTVCGAASTGPGPPN